MLYSIQYLRAIAAWLVVGHHFVQDILNMHIGNGAEYFFARYGFLGVDLFFVISGFVIVLASSNKDETVKTFFLRRVFRIVPNYWFYTLLTLFLIYIFGGFFNYEQVSLQFVISSLLFIPDRNPYYHGFFPLLTVGWSLNYEIYFYALFAMTILVAKHVGYRVALLLIFMFICSWFFSHYSIAEYYASPLVYEFLLGCFGAYIYLKGWVCKINPWIAVGMILLALFYLYIRQPGHHYILAGIPMLLILISSVALEKYAKNNAFSWLGDLSYSTYLSHAIIIFLLRDYVLPLGVSKIAMAILLIVLTVLVSVLTYYFLEKKLYFDMKKRGLI